ncbi:unnamed protein product [Fraxinus pennsylvanica]|uniref:BTB domain-containing protein n=1 Tax=Fraxinus pennsylvanica TaxID=56036 RepID=A0AAD2DS45_9LAMI|nr:unnamed protein product [Fraxinus pennsylvanica]
MDVKILGRIYPVNGSICVKKHNNCTILAASLDMVAKSIERRNNNWQLVNTASISSCFGTCVFRGIWLTTISCRFIRTKIPNDLIIQMEGKSFHLHKLPLVSRSGFINRWYFRIMDMAISVNLTGSIVAPLYCATHFLEMSDDLDQGNLISKTVAFLSCIINHFIMERYGNLSLQIDKLPSGAKYSELVLKFCYGWKVNLTASIVAPLYCAAQFLEMSDDLEQET